MEKALSDMTREELDAIAKNLGIKTFANWKDATVIKKIEETPEYKAEDASVNADDGEGVASQEPLAPTPNERPIRDFEDLRLNPDPLTVNDTSDDQSPENTIHEDAIATRTAQERGDVSKTDDIEKVVADAKAANPAPEAKGEPEKDEAPLMVKYVGSAPKTKLNGVEFALNVASPIPAHKREWFEAKVAGNPSFEIAEG